MITAVRSECVWLQQGYECIPVLLVHSSKGSDIYISGKRQPLTDEIRCHLQYSKPSKTEAVKGNEPTDDDYDDNRERLIWKHGTLREVAYLVRAGFRQPKNPQMQERIQRALKFDEAAHNRELDWELKSQDQRYVPSPAHSREIARELQRQESDFRQLKRDSKPQRRGTRGPIINRSKPTPSNQPETV